MNPPTVEIPDPGPGEGRQSAYMVEIEYSVLVQEATVNRVEAERVAALAQRDLGATTSIWKWDYTYHCWQGVLV